MMKKICIVFCVLFLFLGTMTGQVKVGIMLPLDKGSADGTRMVEYCRGVLMAVDSLKQEGVSVDIVTLNTPANADIKSLLDATPTMKDRDVIFGPFYPQHVEGVASFASKNGNKVVLPYLTNTKELNTNPNLFQIAFNAVPMEQKVVENFITLKVQKEDLQVVIIDCNDTTDTRCPSLTALVKSSCNEHDVKVRVTNIMQTDKNFVKAFSKKKENVVVLNSSSLQKMQEVLTRLDKMREEEPKIQCAVLGFSSWQMSSRQLYEAFCRNDVYVPSTFYCNPDDRKVKKICDGYRFWFKSEPYPVSPSYVISGFDQGYYFIKGISKYGNAFVGSKVQQVSRQMQSPLWFNKVSVNGGYMNNALMFIHFRTDKKTELIMQ
ncbi:MAG: hypothetical protein KBS65_02835 [Prevotella sp.]|nr:hypothetical protein [Candidatus Equicola stercoris]